MTMQMVLPLTIKSGQEDAWEVFFADMRAQVASEEPGTLRFDLHRVIDQQGRYLMIEEYADQAAWEFHSIKQGERGVIPAMMAFTDGPPDFMFLEPVSGALR